MANIILQFVGLTKCLAPLKCGQRARLLWIVFISNILLWCSYSSYAQYYTIKIDSQTPNEQYNIGRFFTANHLWLRAEFYENRQVVSLSNNWVVLFRYTYHQYATQGVATVTGVWTSANVAIFNTTNMVFLASKPYYFSIVGIDDLNRVKTWAVGRMMVEYDPGATTTEDIYYKKVINLNEYTIIGNWGGSNVLFTGAGTTGLITSTTGDISKYLRGDGTWQEVSGGGVATNLFTGAGTTGMVTSTTSDTNKYLRGDGTWQEVSGGGGSEVDPVFTNWYGGIDGKLNFNNKGITNWGENNYVQQGHNWILHGGGEENFIELRADYDWNKKGGYLSLCLEDYLEVAPLGGTWVLGGGLGNDFLCGGRIDEYGYSTLFSGEGLLAYYLNKMELYVPFGDIKIRSPLITFDGQSMFNNNVIVPSANVGIHQEDPQYALDIGNYARAWGWVFQPFWGLPLSPQDFSLYTVRSEDLMITNLYWYDSEKTWKLAPYPMFTGADTTGMVTSTADDANKYLRGDGTWQEISGGGVATNLFTGAGTTGMVTSTTGHTNRVLRGDGTWARTQIYVDRGNHTSHDFAHTNLIMNDNWYDLNLSGIIPTNTVAVHFFVSIGSSAGGNRLCLRAYGYTNNNNRSSVATVVGGGALHHADCIVSMNNTNRLVQYRVKSPATEAYINVKGWWQWND